MILAMRQFETRRNVALEQEPNVMTDLIHRCQYEGLLPCTETYQQTLQITSKLTVADKGLFSFVQKSSIKRGYVKPDFSLLEKVSGDTSIREESIQLPTIPVGRVQLPPFPLSQILSESCTITASTWIPNQY